MDRIPLELFSKITSYLKSSEKLELLRVSQYWYQAIKYTNLYNDFTVKTKSWFEKAIDTFEKEPELTKQVKRVFLIKPEAQFNTILSIPSQFSHLTEFIWEDYLYGEFQGIEIPDNIEQMILHWQKLKVVQEVARHLYFPIILQSTILHNLTRLTINIHLSDKLDRVNQIIDYLDHAPLLNYLDFAYFPFTLQQMETLHQKAPLLETLVLKEAIQLPSDFDYLFEGEQLQSSEVPRTIHIQPATSLKTLLLDRIQAGGGAYGIESRWFLYISQKHINLDNLIITGLGMSSQRPYYQDGLQSMIASCNKLTKYKCRMFQLTAGILQSMDSSGVELKELEIMEVNNVSVKDQLLDLLHSNQKNSITSLRIHGKDCGDQDIFHTLSKFPQLKRLLIQTTAKITLNTSLKKLCNLESLSLSSCDVCFEEEDREVIQLKLKSLQLEKVLIINGEKEDEDEDEEKEIETVDIFQYIAESCPYLTTLGVQGQVNSKAKPFQVHFPSHYFRSIKVYILGNVWYKVNNQLWYKFRGYKLLETMKDQDLQEKPRFYVSVCYKGLTNFNIGGTIIPNWL